MGRLKIIFVSNNILLRWKKNSVVMSNKLYIDDSIVIFQCKKEEISATELLKISTGISNSLILHYSNMVYIKCRVFDIIKYISSLDSLTNDIIANTIIQSDISELVTIIANIRQLDSLISITDIPKDYVDIDQYIYHSDIERVSAYGSVVSIKTDNELNYMDNILKLYSTIKLDQEEYKYISNRLLEVPFSIKIIKEDFQSVLKVITDYVTPMINFTLEGDMVNLSIFANVENYKNLIKCKYTTDNTTIWNIIRQIEEIFKIYNILY